MIYLVASVSLVLGIAIGWAASRINISEREARAELRGLTNRRVLDLTAEDAARRVP